MSHTLVERGASVVAIEADLAGTAAPAAILDEAERRLGPVTALVMCHCESVASGMLDTTIGFDRHFGANTRASWLLIREHGRRFRGVHGDGRIVALTSDHTVGNPALRGSKGALASKRRARPHHAGCRP
jgi:3-oxoacyl-[acyl-carrier protein] reductase